MFTRRTLLALGAVAPFTGMRVAFGATQNLFVHNNRLFLDAKINGAPVRALLDSAAESSFVDGAFARKLGLVAREKVTARGSGGETDAALAKGVKIEALGLSLGPLTVAVLDLANVSRRVDAPLSLVLGRELFDAARIAIDIDGGSIRAVSRAHEPKGVKLPLRTENGIEVFPASVEGHPLVGAAFDLGNGSDVLVGAAYAKTLGLLTDGRAVTKAEGGGIGGSVARDSIVLRSLSIAGRTFENVRAQIDATDSATNLNIGTSLLRNFQITADYSGHALWLT